MPDFNNQYLGPLQCEIAIQHSALDNANSISDMAVYPLCDRGATLHVSSQQCLFYQMLEIGQPM